MISFAIETQNDAAYVDVNDPVRVGCLSLGDKDDIVHFNIYHVSCAREMQRLAYSRVWVEFPVPTTCKALSSCILPLASSRWSSHPYRRTITRSSRAHARCARTKVDGYHYILYHSVDLARKCQGETT